MRRNALLSEGHQSKDELLINYRQVQDNAVQLDGLQPVWSQTWNKFDDDVFSYITPAIHKVEQMIQQNKSKIGSNTKVKHTFSFAYSSNQLRRVILIHSNMDIFPQIRKQITKIFYRIANYFITTSIQSDSDNIFETIVQRYAKIQGRISIIIGCLNLVLNKFITRKGIEDQMFSIINKQLINHSLYESYVNSCLAAVDSLRNSCLTVRQMLNQNNKEMFSQQNQVIKKIVLLNKLKIFPYIEYMQRSKKYYSELLPRVPKNISMFNVLYSYVMCQKMLQSIIIQDKQKIQTAKKILKRQTWRAIQFQSMIKIFCREVLDQIYEDMIEYLDYLIDIEKELREDSLQNPKKTDKILSSQQKQLCLTQLWQLTKILQKNLPAEKQTQYKPSKDKEELHNMKNDRYFTPHAKLINRITTIITDIKKYIGTQQNQQNQKTKPEQIQLYKIIKFKNTIFLVISECFQNDSKLLTAASNAIQQAIIDEEESYNSQLCSIILSPFYIFPGSQQPKQNSSNIMSQKMIEQDQQICSQAYSQNSKYSYQLFKLTPSKQQFIRKFQQQFSNYVIPFTEQKIDLSEQQKFIRPLQKQCGHILSKNIERMLNDVWKNNEMVYFKYSNFICRILCQDWPSFQQAKYRLADVLLQLRAYFQVDFLAQPDNEKKKLKWIQDYGKIRMSICGIQSVFSQFQSSIVLLLSRSYRPIRLQQFVEVLEYTGNDINLILQDLVDKNVIIFSEDACNYELNYQNQYSYIYDGKQKSVSKKHKKTVEKDQGIVIEAMIARILKRRKSVQKTDLAKLLSEQVRDSRQPTIQQVNNALQRLKARDIINIEKARGIIKYIQ